MKRKPNFEGQQLTMGVFGKLIERIGSITGEFKRKKIDGLSKINTQQKNVD
jgi:hypothetical protein